MPISIHEIFRRWPANMEIGILPILSFVNPPTNSLDAVEEKKGVLYTN